MGDSRRKIARERLLYLQGTSQTQLTNALVEIEFEGFVKDLQDALQRAADEAHKNQVSKLLFQTAMGLLVTLAFGLASPLAVMLDEALFGWLAEFGGSFNFFSEELVNFETWKLLQPFVKSQITPWLTNIYQPAQEKLVTGKELDDSSSFNGKYLDYVTQGDFMVLEWAQKNMSSAVLLYWLQYYHNVSNSGFQRQQVMKVHRHMKGIGYLGIQTTTDQSCKSYHLERQGTYRVCNEDVDYYGLCWRLKSSGETDYYVFGTCAFHKETTDIQGDPVQLSNFVWKPSRPRVDTDWVDRSVDAAKNQGVLWEGPPEFGIRDCNCEGYVRALFS